MSAKMQGGRETGIELLRCVLMLLIVFGHCCIFGSGTDARIAKTLAAPGVFATDAFVLISGWFGIRFSTLKVVRFLGLGAFACVIITLSGWLLGIESPFGYSLGWFGNSYLALMLLAPMINAGLEALNEKGLMGRAWLLYASAMFLAWLPVRCVGFDFVPTGWSGLSFNTMCFVYVTGRVMRESGWAAKVRTHKAIIIFVGLMILNLLWAGLAAKAQSPLARGIFVGSRDYNSPIALGLAISFFLLLRQISFNGWVAKTIGWCAPSMFSVYLISEGCNGRVSRAIYNRYAYFDFGSGVVGAVLQIGVASILVFAVCLMLDLARRVSLWSISAIRK